MAKLILVLNGEPYWAGHLRGYDVVVRRLQDCSWVLRDGRLTVVDREGAVRPDGILWRVGAIRLLPRYRAVLETIRLSGVPCVNAPGTLLRCFDRLSTMAEMREAGMPVVEGSVVVGDNLVKHIARPTPFVVKAGNHHAGFGTALVRTNREWSDIADLLFAVDEYVVTEPYVEAVRDVRCLAVGDELWALERESHAWKETSDASRFTPMPIPDGLENLTRRAQDHLAADVIALDFLERIDGSYVLLGANDTPGLAGYPEIVRDCVAQTLMDRIDRRR